MQYATLDSGNMNLLIKSIQSNVVYRCSIADAMMKFCLHPNTAVVKIMKSMRTHAQQRATVLLNEHTVPSQFQQKHGDLPAVHG